LSLRGRIRKCVQFAAFAFSERALALTATAGSEGVSVNAGRLSESARRAALTAIYAVDAVRLVGSGA